MYGDMGLGEGDGWGGLRAICLPPSQGLGASDEGGGSITDIGPHVSDPRRRFSVRFFSCSLTSWQVLAFLKTIEVYTRISMV